jgi:hypothetical protein
MQRKMMLGIKERVESVTREFPHHHRASP